MSAVIRVSDLTKQYSGLRAVDGLSFTVEQGEIYGFLGQNGAGKSTTIRMLLTLIAPTGGEIELFGMNLRTHRRDILRRVGAVIERPDLYKYMTAYENLSIFARMSGIRPTTKLMMDQLEQVGLAERAHSKVRTFSQGMKQRLGIAVALVHGPDLVILDEPTNGLDPQGIADIRNLILHLGNNERKTLLISSHLLSEMELIAGSMLIIDKGRKIVEGRVSELFDPSDTLVELHVANGAHALFVINGSIWRTALEKANTGGLHNAASRGDAGGKEAGRPAGKSGGDGQGSSGNNDGNGQTHYLLKMDKADVPVFIADMVAGGVQVLGIQPRHSLEDYFLSLTSANQHVDPFAN